MAESYDEGVVETDVDSHQDYSQELTNVAAKNYSAETGKMQKPALRPNSVPVRPSPRDSLDFTKEQLVGFNRCTRCQRVVKVPSLELSRNGKDEISNFAVRKITTPIPFRAWPADAHEAYNEVKKLTQMKEHPNLVTFRAMFDKEFEADWRQPTPFVSMEWHRKGSLNSLIQKHFELRGAFTGRQIVNYMLQLSSAVGFLHSNNILHRDIRPKNIFILDDNILKLADAACPKIYQNRTHASRFTAAFWLAKHRLNAGPLHCCMSSPSSWPYMPPEIMCEFKKRAKEDIHVCDNKLYEKASEVWSMGIVLYEMLVLKLPFAGRIPKQIQKSIADAAPLSQLWVQPVRTYSPEVTGFVNKMILLHPTERIKVRELEKMDLLQAATEGSLEKVKQLVSERCNINEKDANGFTALGLAAQAGHTDIVEYLIKQRADVNIKSRSGGSAEEWAKTDEIKNLIEKAQHRQQDSAPVRQRNN